MYIELLLKTVILGFCIAAPVGPIGILCINNTLNHGLKNGIVTGFGAAFADVVFGSIVAFGLLYLQNLLMSHQKIIQIIGVILLLYLGIKMFFSKKNSPIKKKIALSKTFITTFALTITNPMTILSFLAVYSSLGFVNYDTNIYSSVFFVLGIFLGSSLWWFVLSICVSFFRLKLYKVLPLINKISGITIIIFALIILKKF